MYIDTSLTDMAIEILFFHFCKHGHMIVKLIRTRMSLTFHYLITKLFIFVKKFTIKRRKMKMKKMKYESKDIIREGEK